MDNLTEIVVAVVGGAALVWAAWLQFGRKKAEPDDKSAAERAIDEVFAEVERLRALLGEERDAHRITTRQYIEASTRLASVEAHLNAARADVRERDAVIAQQRAEIADLRRQLEVAQ